MSRLGTELRAIADRAVIGNDRHLLLDLARLFDTRNCDKCCGMGERAYGSTATWRGGVGGQSITTDVCDKCWGSGNSDEPGLDLRKHEAALRESTLKAELAGFAALCRLFGRQPHDGMSELLRVIEAQRNRRKLPDGVQPFWYGQLIEAFCVQLRRYVDAAKERA